MTTFHTVLKSVTVLSLLAATVGRAQPAAPASTDTVPAGELRVVNGDFGDLAGLTAGADGWHAGVPRGWTSESADATYAVHDQAGPSAPVCNVSVLGFLLQDVGTLTEVADVVLRFDVSSPWPTGANLGAALLDGNRQPLVQGEFEAGTTPALDNVAISK